MIAPISERYLSHAQTALRVVAGAAFFVHGAQKAFGWFGGMGPSGTAVDMMSKFGAAGAIEVVLGICLVLGLMTRWAAFLASGEMAIAYFWVHASGSSSVLWWANRGETVMLFSFIWLVFAAWGAGPYSIDAMLGRKHTSR